MRQPGDLAAITTVGMVRHRSASRRSIADIAIRCSRVLGGVVDDIRRTT